MANDFYGFYGQSTLIGHRARPEIQRIISGGRFAFENDKPVKAEGVAKLYFDHIYKLHGLPKGIVSDRDSKFTGAFWRALQKMIGTDLMMSTTSHPQTDGQTEHVNRSILQILWHFVNLIGSDWAQYLPTIEFAINSAVSTSTGKALFELIYSYLPRTFPPIVYDEDNPVSMNFIENRILAQRSAQDANIAAKTEVTLC